MEGIIFYDESSGIAPLKSTVANRGPVKVRRLDENNVRVLEAISRLDPEGSDYPIHDEALMRVIDSSCKADVGIVPDEESYLYWNKSYTQFSNLVEAKWSALRHVFPHATPEESTTTAWRPGRTAGKGPCRYPQPEYFNSEENGFFLLPVEMVAPCLPQLGSMTRLWNFLYGNPTGRPLGNPTGRLSGKFPGTGKFHTIANGPIVKVFDDSLHKILHIAYLLRGEDDVILVRLKGSKVQTFELKIGDKRYFVISMESPKEDLSVIFLNFLEWGIDEAYDMLFEEQVHEPASKIVVDLKIKK